MEHPKKRSKLTLLSRFLIGWVLKIKYWNWVSENCVGGGMEPSYWNSTLVQTWYNMLNLNMLDFHVLDCSRTRLYYRDSRMCLWMFLNIEKNVPESKMCSEFVQSFVTCFENLLWIKISRMNSMGEIPYEEFNGRNSYHQGSTVKNRSRTTPSRKNQEN